MKYFIFDVDGTLLNSAEVDQQCLQQMLREFGQEHTLEELRPSFGKPGRQTLADLGFSGEAAERAMDRWEGLSQERIAEVRAFNGVEAMLKALHERGCRCGIVTSRTHYQYGYGFSPLGLDGYFDAVICMEDAPRTKPAPDPLLECLRRARRSTSATARAICSAPPRRALPPALRSGAVRRPTASWQMSVWPRPGTF